MIHPKDDPSKVETDGQRRGNSLGEIALQSTEQPSSKVETKEGAMELEHVCEVCGDRMVTTSSIEDVKQWACIAAPNAHPRKFYRAAPPSPSEPNSEPTCEVCGVKMIMTSTVGDRAQWTCAVLPKSHPRTFRDASPAPKSEPEKLPEGCSGVDWCERHQTDHGHPEPPKSDVPAQQRGETGPWDLTEEGARLWAESNHQFDSSCPICSEGAHTLVLSLLAEIDRLRASSQKSKGDSNV